MKYSGIAAIIGFFGVVITALLTTLPGQAALVLASNWVFELFTGKTLLQTLWDNPLVIFDMLF